MKSFSRKLSLEEIAVLEAARIALSKARQHGQFDQEVFEAVAESQLKKLQGEIFQVK